MFYNVENLFHPSDDPEKEDNEFTVNGARRWTYGRLYKKLLNLSKVILSASGWQTPAIIGLCEIENREVLELLLSKTPLKTKSYKIIHKESPDSRGIDVAFLYDPKRFYPLKYRLFPLKNKDGSVRKTREILYVSGVINDTDTLHFFVNHWPSRFGGLLETQPDRKRAASVLRQKTDELFDKCIDPKIIILGDFNDNPSDLSLKETLGAERIKKEVIENQLYNLSYDWLSQNEGTLKYKSVWSVFDQIIVSGSLLLSDSGLTVKQGSATIVDSQFLFEKDERYGGLKLKRSYYGYKYKGGFSDHLPVKVVLHYNN